MDALTDKIKGNIFGGLKKGEGVLFQSIKLEKPWVLFKITYICIYIHIYKYIHTHGMIYT